MPMLAAAPAPTNTPGRRSSVGTRVNVDALDRREALVLDGGSSSRRARICEVGSINHGSRRAAARICSGVGSDPNRSSSRSTRLTCACASGVSSQTQRTASEWRSRDLDHAAAGRPRQVGVVEHPARTPAASCSPRAPRPARGASRRARRGSGGRSRARRYSGGVAALTRAWDAHHDHDLAVGARGSRGGRAGPGRGRATEGRSSGGLARPRRARAPPRARPTARSPAAGRPGSPRPPARARAATRAPPRPSWRRGAPAISASSRRRPSVPARRGPPSGECAITVSPSSAQRVDDAASHARGRRTGSARPGRPRSARARAPRRAACG